MLAGCLLSVVACTKNSTITGEPPAADYGRVRTMSSFYEGYLREHGNQPPPSEQAFREYLNTKQENLQKAGLKIEEMFLSPRNAKPLQWAFGQKVPYYRQNNMACYAYETEPVGGKRLVIGNRGMFVELDETNFRSVFPKG
jgi:hypothetical protein